MKRFFCFVCLLLSLCLLMGCTKGTNPTNVTANKPETTVEPTPEPTPDPALQYFSSTERIEYNPNGMEWLYANHSLNIHIERRIDKEKNISYFVAHIRTRNNANNHMNYTLPYYGRKPGTGNVGHTFKIARKERAVLVINTDFFHDGRNPKGVIIRNGQVYFDDDKSDTLAILPDGSMKPYDKGECNAQMLQDMGVQTALSFGPTLMRDGRIEEDKCLNGFVRPKNPRMGIGMVDKNHFVIICVEGRVPGSSGATLIEYAQMFADENCTDAYNLDGGATISMSFMGHQINRITPELDYYKMVPDVLCVGYSHQVPKMNQRFNFPREDGKAVSPTIVLNDAPAPAGGPR